MPVDEGIGAMIEITLLLLGSVWIGGGLMAVALCRMAARGDRRHAEPRPARRGAPGPRPAPRRGRGRHAGPPGAAARAPGAPRSRAALAPGRCIDPRSHTARPPDPTGT